MNYSKYKLENEVLFLILLKYNSTQIQQYWYSQCNSKEIYLYARNGRANLKFTFNLNAIAVSVFLLQFSFTYNPASYLWKRSLEDLYHSPLNVFFIKGNILITIIRFAFYHCFIASSSTIMTDSMYVGTIQICQNLNEHHYYLISTTSVI